MLFKKFSKDRSGATAIEYGLIVSLICLVVASAIGGTGNSVGAKWADNANRVNAFLK